MRIRFLVLIFAACTAPVLANAETSGAKSGSNPDDVELAKACATMARHGINVAECVRFGAAAAVKPLPVVIAKVNLATPAVPTLPVAKPPADTSGTPFGCCGRISTTSYPMSSPRKASRCSRVPRSAIRTT